MAACSREQLERRVAAIREEFRRSLPRRMVSLRTQWGLVGALHQGSSAALSALLRQAHTLKGSAATFRFDAISRRADELLQTLRPLVSQKRLPDASERVRIEGLLAELEAQMQG